MKNLQSLTELARRVIHKIAVLPYQKGILGSLGKKTSIAHSTKWDNPENIFIGSMVSIGRHSWLAAKPLTGKATCQLVIGNGTYIGNNAHIYCTSRICLETSVLIADKVYISDNLHTFKDIKTPIIKQPILQVNEVTIHEGAWIGENACIIGASVGKNSVVGAGSIVTHNIPDFCIAVGAPARIIKRYSFEKQDWLKTDQNGNFQES